jgi:hypothetical protein
VENSAEKLVLRVDGQNKTYAPSDLPPAVALVLAQKWLDKDAAETRLAIGAFQAMDRRADRTQAMAHFEAAATLGRQDAASQLIAELGALPPPVSKHPPAANATATTGPSGRAPLPSVAAQTKAKAEVRALFKDEHLAAADDGAKLALAEKLLARAAAEDDLPLRHALLGQSQLLAALAGDFDQAFAVIDKLDASFVIDPLDAKIDLLFEALKSVESPESNGKLASAALLVSDLAVLEDKSDQALRAVRIAGAAARKSRDAELVKQCADREKDLKSQR